MKRSFKKIFLQLTLIALAVCVSSIAKAEVVCNQKSKNTNVRKGPSAKNFGTLATLKNGYYLEVLERVTNDEGYLYFRVKFQSGQLSNGKLLYSTGYVYHEAVSKSCKSDKAKATARAAPKKATTTRKSSTVNRTRAWALATEALKLRKQKRYHSALAKIMQVVPNNLSVLQNKSKPHFTYVRAILHDEAKQYDSAFKWYQRVVDYSVPGNRYGVTAKRNNNRVLEARHSLGFLYFIGRGVSRNRSKGEQLLRQNSALGYKKSSKLLKTIADTKAKAKRKARRNREQANRRNRQKAKRRSDGFCYTLSSDDARYACLQKPFLTQNTDARAILLGQCFSLSNGGQKAGYGHVCSQGKNGCYSLKNSKLHYPCTSCGGSRKWAATAAAGSIITCYKR